MASIKPFKGILYDKKKIGDFSKVAAPPYDVITSAEQDELYNLSDFNVVRLILGKEYSNDTDSHNKYTRAAQTFKSWLQQAVLRQDSDPSIYVYQQEYELKKGKKAKRTGYVSLVKLESLDGGRIRPHEKTLSQPKQDRFNLLNAAHASFCQIFSLYSDPKNEIEAILQDLTQDPPDVEVSDNDAVLHRIWRVSDQRVISEIARIMSDKTLYIADGHHRYETALRFQQKMLRTRPHSTGEELFNYTMMMLVDINSQDLTILPIHRVLKNLEQEMIARLTENLKPYFDIDTYEFDIKTEPHRKQEFFKLLKSKGEKNHVFGMYIGNSKYHLLTLKNEQILDRILSEENAQKWRKLDVAILHFLIIDSLLHVSSTDSEIQTHIEHLKDEDLAIDLVDSNEYQLAFFLNPTKVSQVKDISSKGEVLPQKSTFFYPKLLSGLVMFKIE